jgi:hypothetical protein
MPKRCLQKTQFDEHLVIVCASINPLVVLTSRSMSSAGWVKYKDTPCLIESITPVPGGISSTGSRYGSQGKSPMMKVESGADRPLLHSIVR